MNTVGIYRSVFPWPSETFITEQASHLRRYQPTFFVRKRTGRTPFPTVAIDEHEAPGLRRALHTLTRSPRLFPDLTDCRCDVLHAHFAVDGVYALPLAERLRAPLLVSVHGYEITSHRRPSWRKGSQRKFQFLQYLLRERQLQEQAAGFIAVSDFIRRRLLERGYADRKIRVHYIGVDTELFRPWAGSKPERYVLSVGRHVEKKGLDTLLSAWKTIERRHPSVSLVQVGTGPLSDSLMAYARDNGIAHRVRFLGVQPHDEVLRLMQLAEVFCLPSRTAASGDCEGLGIVFNEASACGVPVVATRHGGIPEAVIDGETGLLVDENDAGDLARVLDTLLSDRALGARLGCNGREYVCQRFDARTQCARLEEIYDAIR